MKKTPKIDEGIKVLADIPNYNVRDFITRTRKVAKNLPNKFYV